MKHVTFPPNEELNDLADYQGVDAVVRLLDDLIGKYPVKPTKPTMHVREATAKQAREYADALEAYENQMASFHKETNAYKDQETIKEILLIKVIKEFNNFENTVPEKYKNKVWAKAWEDGHSYGWNEVSSKLGELVKIFE